MIEVLGAVALLAFVYTSLSTVAITWLRSQGESQRLLEASLLADWHFAELEMQLDAGVLPEIGETEIEVGEVGESDDSESRFEVTLDAESFEAPISDPATDALPLRDLEPAPNWNGEWPIRVITLTVTWLEGENERTVVRTTYGIDVAAVSEQASRRAGENSGQRSGLPQEGGP